MTYTCKTCGRECGNQNGLTLHMKSHGGVSAELNISGRLYKSEGATVEEALLNLRPGVAKGKAVLTIKKGGKMRDRVLSFPQVNRIFNPSPTLREVAIIQTAKMFKL